MPQQLLRTSAPVVGDRCERAHDKGAITIAKPQTRVIVQLLKAFRKHPHTSAAHLGTHRGRLASAERRVGDDSRREALLREHLPAQNPAVAGNALGEQLDGHVSSDVSAIGPDDEEAAQTAMDAGGDHKPSSEPQTRAPVAT